MLTTLTIRNVVLIEQVTLNLLDGLCALTGETGAGKSILLDALGLALGMRAEARLVRSGTDMAVVTAVFECSDSALASVKPLLDEQGIEVEDGQIILRRSLTPDGRSKAFINDMPVSAGFLRGVGDLLVEIHGQFETATLLNQATHRAVLDDFCADAGAIEACRNAYVTWKQAEEDRIALMRDVAKAQEDETFLRTMVEELETLSPYEGEEEELSQKRALMMHAEKLAGALTTALQGVGSDGGALRGLYGALNALEAVQDKAEGRMDEAIAALNRANVELDEAVAQLESLSGDFDFDAGSQNAVEQRLFDLKAAARKHHTTVDMLLPLKKEMEDKLALIGDQSDKLAELEKKEAVAKQDYITAAATLHTVRMDAAKRLDVGVMKELPPLKLERARFQTTLTRIEDEREWGQYGFTRAVFEIATNAGSPMGPLSKIASGGEMARFMLALKVVLAQSNTVPTMIFDEVDSGIGGAVAQAVGERLQRLGGDVQVLVVTHSPQVAGRAHHHYTIHKTQSGEHANTYVTPLESKDERREELARMLSGAHITDEARAAADKLFSVG